MPVVGWRATSIWHLASSINPIKNPAEHREGEATGPEQRRGRLNAPSKGDNKDQAIAFHTIVGFRGSKDIQPTN